MSDVSARGISEGWGPTQHVASPSFGDLLQLSGQHTGPWLFFSEDIQGFLLMSSCDFYL